MTAYFSLCSHYLFLYFHSLVVKALRPMEGTRKCYRLVGGVLVERTVSEVLPAIETNLGGIDKLVQTLMEQLKTLEKAAEEFRTEHDLAFSRDQAAGNGGDKKKGGAAGVLV